METYKVQIVVTHSFDVEAANEEEAREEAKEVIWDDHIDGYEMSLKTLDEHERVPEKKYKVSFHTWFELDADDDEDALDDAFYMFNSGNLTEGVDYTIEKVAEQSS